MGVIQLTRPGNALLSGIGVLVGVLASGVLFFASDLYWEATLLVTLSGILGTAGGNALNDLVDIDVDRTAHPKRPLPQGKLTRRTARTVVLLAWALAVPAAMLAHVNAGLLAAFDVALLSAYEMRLKRKGLPGNLAVAFASGSVFPLGALAVGGDVRLPLVLGLIAMAAHLGRELLKDAEDAHHDRATRDTFAVRHGTRPAAAVAAVAFALAIGLSVLPHLWFGWANVSLYVIVVADVLFIAAAALGTADPGRGRRLAKLAMVVALVAFLLGSLGR